MRRMALLCLCGAWIGCGGGGGGEDDAGDTGGADTTAPPADSGLDQDAGDSDDGSVVPDVPLDGAPSDANSDSDTSADTGETVGTVVSTLGGALEGSADDGLVVFRGIPYAAPPVGSLRFRAPEPHPGWSGVRDATTFGPACPQRANNDQIIGDEDCLTLNVWAHAGGNPRPVMVFVHGGGFAMGQGAQTVYEGSDLARDGGVVVVTLNYRLGALGFLATEALGAESADGSVGNYGLRDQVAALRWVADNIAAFGGDPDEVTVFGESAGALSVCALIGTPLADGLFHRAIVQSGGGCFGFEEPDVAYQGRDSMMARGAALVADLGCDGEEELECLRGLLVPDLLAAQPPGRGDLARTLLATVTFAPNLDGVVLAEDPAERLRRGAIDLPIIVGSNADEARAFTVTTPILTWNNFENRVEEIFGAEDAAEILPLYPQEDYERPRQAYDAVLTDVGFTCPTISLADASAAGDPTWVYYFTRVMDGAFGALGATHAVELLFVFGNWPDNYTPAAEDLVVEAAMQGAWTSLATSGEPGLQPAWAPWTSSAPTFAIFDAPTQVVSGIRGGRCAALRERGLVP